MSTRLAHALLSTALLFLSATLSAAFAADAASRNRYIGVLLNHVDADSARGVDQGLGATFLYGFPMRNPWSIEARITGLILERGDSGGTDFYQQDIGADAVFRLQRINEWQPFALAGVSLIRNDVEVSALDDVGAGLHLGAGVTSPSLGSMSVQLRGELRYVHDTWEDGHQDLRLGIGISIPLGGRVTASTTPRPVNDRVTRANDVDEDGVSDDVDRCPNSLPYVKHDQNGCMQPNQVIRMYEVTFDNGTAVLTSGAREELSSVVRALRGQPDLPVRVDGHTDAMGDSDRNRRLSLERANAVATYLVLQGVPTQRLSIKGHGETQPVDSNATASGRERNRRIEIVLLEPAGH